MSNMCFSCLLLSINTLGTTAADLRTQHCTTRSGQAPESSSGNNAHTISIVTLLVFQREQESSHGGPETSPLLDQMLVFKHMEVKTASEPVLNCRSANTQTRSRCASISAYAHSRCSSDFLHVIFGSRFYQTLSLCLQGGHTTCLQHESLYIGNLVSRIWNNKASCICMGDGQRQRPLFRAEHDLKTAWLICTGYSTMNRKRRHQAKPLCLIIFKVSCYKQYLKSQYLKEITGKKYFC